MFNEDKHNGGVYEFDVPKTDNYARIGRTFYVTDPMHAYFLAKGESPAFPDKEDLPRDSSSSFDNYYIIIDGKSGRMVHRITLIRANVALPWHERSCYVNGNLIFSTYAVGKKKRVKVFLYNSKEWKSGAQRGHVPCFWFYLDGVKVTIIGNFYMNAHVSLWASSFKKTPDHYGIFIGEQSISITTGRTLAEEEPQPHKWCPSTFYLLFAWPLYVVWVLLITFVWIPVQHLTSKVEVRNYLVEKEEDKGWRATQIYAPLIPQTDSGEV